MSASSIEYSEILGLFRLLLQIANMGNHFVSDCLNILYYDGEVDVLQYDRRYYGVERVFIWLIRRFRSCFNLIKQNDLIEDFYQQKLKN